jgi:HK97 family phage prohead protease
MAETIRREFAVTLSRAGADQRTLGGCCVPYNRATTVSDDRVSMYREMFAPGCFGRQLAGTTVSRIALKYRHGEGLLDTVGRATQLDERDDGLWGMFRVFEGVVGDQALVLVDEGLLTGLSVSGVPMRTTKTADGTVVRERLHLTEISLCEQPAYSDALVSVRRSRVELDLPERPSDDQLARLAKVGIVLGR